jgi:hypothetical protein
LSTSIDALVLPERESSEKMLMSLLSWKRPRYAVDDFEEKSVVSEDCVVLVVIVLVVTVLVSSVRVKGEYAESLPEDV